MDIRNLYNQFRDADPVQRIDLKEQYKSNFAHKTVHLCPNATEVDIEEYDTEIIVAGSTRCLNFVGSFGSEIRDLYVNYSTGIDVMSWRDHIIALNHSMSQFCVNLMSITLFKPPKDLLARASPIAAQNVGIISGSMKCSAIMEVFADVVDLSLINTTSELGVYGQLWNLRHFTFINNTERDCDIIESICDLWESNNVIESINIEMPNASNINWNHVVKIAEPNRLASLKLSTARAIGNASHSQIVKFCDEQHQLQILHLTNFHFIFLNVSTFLNRLPNLQEFRCRIAYTEDWSQLRQFENNWRIQSYHRYRLVTFSR